jgi:adenosylhomocysteine nucleosidase
VTLLVACGLVREARIFTGPDVVAVAGGGDAERLEAALERAIAAGGVTAMLSSGIAGALDPALTPGDVVIGTLAGAWPGSASQRKPDARTAPPLGGLGSSRHRASGSVAELMRWIPRAHRGTIVGSDTIAATLEEKRALYQATGALAVDMESHIAARVAERHALPFAILRTISDGAGHVLPPAALVGMKPDGSMALGAVLASLARHPAQLPALIRTGRDAGRAFKSLEQAWATLSDRNHDAA